jgi:hypothetical protein
VRVRRFLPPPAGAAAPDAPRPAAAAAPPLCVRPRAPRLFSLPPGRVPVPHAPLPPLPHVVHPPPAGPGPPRVPPLLGAAPAVSQPGSPPHSVLPAYCWKFPGKQLQLVCWCPLSGWRRPGRRLWLFWRRAPPRCSCAEPGRRGSRRVHARHSPEKPPNRRENRRVRTNVVQEQRVQTGSRRYRLLWPCNREGSVSAGYTYQG